MQPDVLPGAFLRGIFSRHHCAHACARVLKVLRERRVLAELAQRGCGGLAHACCIVLQTKSPSLAGGRLSVTAKSKEGATEASLLWNPQARPAPL